MIIVVCGIFFFKQKTAYDRRISDWSSDVCSSDLPALASAARCQGCRSAAACAMNEAAMQAQPEVKRSLWRRWLIDPVVAQLRQGITPERIALTLALASIISVFPILCSTTLLCALVAAWLRLNQPLIQLANYLFYDRKRVV